MSDQPKHTQGPWTIHKQNAYHISYVVRGGEKENQIAQCFNWQDKGFDANSEANAHLIAAAPDLLDALKDMLSGWRYIRQDSAHQCIYGVGWDRAQSAAEAAIAKAEGRDA